MFTKILTMKKAVSFQHVIEEHRGDTQVEFQPENVPRLQNGEEHFSPLDAGEIPTKSFEDLSDMSDDVSYGSSNDSFSEESTPSENEMQISSTQYDESVPPADDDMHHEDVSGQNSTPPVNDEAIDTNDDELQQEAHAKLLLGENIPSPVARGTKQDGVDLLASDQDKLLNANQIREHFKDIFPSENDVIKPGFKLLPDGSGVMIHRSEAFNLQSIPAECVSNLRNEMLQSRINDVIAASDVVKENQSIEGLRKLQSATARLSKSLSSCATGNLQTLLGKVSEQARLWGDSRLAVAVSMHNQKKTAAEVQRLQTRIEELRNEHGKLDKCVTDAIKQESRTRKNIEIEFHKNIKRMRELIQKLQATREEIKKMNVQKEV